MTSPDADPPRSCATGLVLFGILDISVGALYLGKTVVFGLLAVSGAADRMPAAADRGEIAVTAAAALPAAAFFLAIGFGSIAARRWARALTLAFASLWLGAGALGTAFLLACLPRVFAAVEPVSAHPGKDRLLSYAAILLVGVVLPAAYVLFYGSAGVREETERRDPEERWTDAVSLPALAAAMLLAVGALLAVDLAFSTSRQLLFFGHPLGGALRAAAAAAAAIEVLAAWGVCRSDARAWVAAVAIMGARSAVDAGIAWRIARNGIAPIALRSANRAPDARAAIERLEPLHPLATVALFVTLLALLSWTFVAWAALRERRAARPAAAGG